MGNCRRAIRAAFNPHRLSLAQDADDCFWPARDIANETFLTWWHSPVEIKPRFFQRKSVADCAISAYVHGGGGGTIVYEIALCWETADGPQTTVRLEGNRKYFVPVTLRSDPLDHIFA